MIPQLRDLAARFADQLTIIGVHSGKYIAERETARIRDAALRLGNDHPIVNDRQFRVWRAYGVHAWPTLAVVTPGGGLIGMHAGEFTADALAALLGGLAAPAGGWGPAPPHVPADAPGIAPGELRYPGKIAVRGRDLAIADSGHHRVLLARLSDDGTRAAIERVVGSGTPGFADGTAADFRSPQGLCFDGDTLFVADAGNHAVRAVALASGAVRTVAGTGRQLRSREDLHAGALSSPWDLAPSRAGLVVAMAGVHQLWVLDPGTGRVRLTLGSGREDLADGSGAAAALAQPMGLAADGDRIWFTDAESSAVRGADLGSAARVTTIAGTGLFDFGDRDGTGEDALLQHPQGIARHRDGRLLVADSYNDALKWVDPGTRAVRTWVRGLHEPSGVACGERHALVADTNAHRIVAVDYESGVVETVVIA